MHNVRVLRCREERALIVGNAHRRHWQAMQILAGTDCVASNNDTLKRLRHLVLHETCFLSRLQPNALCHIFILYRGLLLLWLPEFLNELLGQTKAFFVGSLISEGVLLRFLIAFACFAGNSVCA
eukprot:Mycagemm_TRINITY_DN9673_c0_g2::TRINITY_DN9673_c0_g2_i1::g.2581::m.2581 type:complete len:124 gc:universal TRINITY_DN9673_c0_g2_i1:243-614(+)